MATLVNTSAVQALGWSSVLGRCHLEKTYLPILAISLSNPNKGLEEAAKAGDMDLVVYFVSQGANDWSERSSNPTSYGRSKAPTLHPLDV